VFIGAGDHIARALEQAELATAQVQALERSLGYLQDDGSGVASGLPLVEVNRINLELLKGEVRELAPTRVNQELLKGEVRELLSRLEELGQAFAPGAGIDGAAARFAELREQVNAIERRMRLLGSMPVAVDNTRSVTGQPTAENRFGDDKMGASSELFNYVGFERRFRGDPEDILHIQEERYGQLLEANGPVVDLGCGRGELLELLTARGVEAVGVELDAGLVAEARARGVRVEHVDALDFLRRAEPRSFGAIFSAHLAEHLQLDYLLELLDLSVSRLRPGGVFVAETPNPASLIVLGNSYILDPTHVRPLHPSLMSFLCESAGFRDVRLELYAPATGYHLPLVAGPDVPPWALTVNEALIKLNNVLFGPQEYAVFARTPPPPAE
jgi:SAM-dependent methyltransferase